MEEVKVENESRERVEVPFPGKYKNFYGTEPSFRNFRNLFTCVNVQECVMCMNDNSPKAILFMVISEFNLHDLFLIIPISDI